MRLRFLLLLVAVVAFASCKHASNVDMVTKIVSEWEGKEIVFPESPVFTIQAQVIKETVYLVNAVR